MMAAPHGPAVRGNGMSRHLPPVMLKDFPDGQLEQSRTLKASGRQHREAAG
jgi:hypothetical protein